MTFSPRIASLLFATSLLAWGIIHFIAGDFIAGRPQPWPEGASGKTLVAYASGLMLIAASVSIVVQKHTRLAATAAGLMILVYAALPNLIRVLTTLDYGGLMTNTGKSITFGFGALLIASTFPHERMNNLLSKSLPMASIATGIFLVAGGIQHFIFVDFVKTLVPRWIPGDVFWTYVAGVGLIASGAALITGVLRKTAATVASWMVLTWVVVLHVPRALEHGNINEWTAVFEALAVAAILMVIAQEDK